MKEWAAAEWVKHEAEQRVSGTPTATMLDEAVNLTPNTIWHCADTRD